MVFIPEPQQAKEKLRQEVETYRSMKREEAALASHGANTGLHRLSAWAEH